MEVLIVVMLTAVLMYSMSVIFTKAALITGVSEAEVETRQNARGIFSRLELDLSSAFVDDNNNYFRCSGGLLEFVTTLKYNPEGFAGRLDITQVAYERVDGSESTTIKGNKGYPVTDEEPLLVRYVLTYLTQKHVETYANWYPDQPQLSSYTRIDLATGQAKSYGQYTDIIATNITSFDIQFLDEKISTRIAPPLGLERIDTYWTNTWRPAGNRPLPRALKIRVGLTDKRKLVNRMFESIMHPNFTRRSTSQESTTP